MLRLSSSALLLCAVLALAACGGQPPPPAPTSLSAPTASASQVAITGAPTAGATVAGGPAAPGCVRACVTLDSEDGPVLVGATICFTSGDVQGSEIGKSDALGKYSAQVPRTEGPEMIIGAWPVKAGYWFTPAYVLFDKSRGGQWIVTNFVARPGNETPKTDACSWPPYIK